MTRDIGNDQGDLKRVHGWVRYWCRHHGIDIPGQDIGDVVHDTWIKATSTYQRGKAPWWTWVGIVARSKVLDYVRAKTRHERRHATVGSDDGLERLVGRDAQPDEVAETADLSAHAVAIVRTLLGDTKSGQIWLACYVDAKSDRELATQFGVKLAAVSTAKYRINKVLREQLQD